MLAQTATELEQIIAAAEPRLRILPGEIIAHRPAADRWTIQEVLGHLIDSAANNHQRFVRAQFTAELVFPKYEQNQWVAAAQYQAAPWPVLVDLWSSYNQLLAHLIRHANPAALPRICIIGPYEPVTLEFLIADYVVHLRHHLEKIGERAGVALLPQK
ncbi:DinB family protein [Anatilimnocola floriformis]|uniref:DinB family protein n=1 Tax=Anatilimnocola floriformis TaxID=2948575 RepID=UPI0020C32774|nr:DinB family protein [Anatilimnocola floriformis]